MAYYSSTFAAFALVHCLMVTTRWPKTSRFSLHGVFFLYERWPTAKILISKHYMPTTQFLTQLPLNSCCNATFQIAGGGTSIIAVSLYTRKRCNHKLGYSQAWHP